MIIVDSAIERRRCLNQRTDILRDAHDNGRARCKVPHRGPCGPRRRPVG
jgi:hypothetical protein